MSMGVESVFSGSMTLAQAAAGATPAGMPGATAAPAAGTTAAPGGAAPLGAPAGAAPQGLGPMIWLLPAMLVVMIGMSLWTGRKEKKKREALMNSIKKYDKVTTIAGIVGEVAELNDHDVVLRVEDGRIRFSRSAITGVIGESRAASSIVEGKGAKNETAKV
jgi:preprotein translocase subunit YajC